MVNGQIGYCATNHLNQSAIQQAAEIAQQQAEKASKWSIFKFNTDIRPPAKGSYQSPITESANLVHPQELNDLLVQICHRLRVSDKVVKATAMAGISDISSHFVSSNGANIQQQFSLVETDYAAIAQDGNIIQKRSDNGMLARCYQAGKEVFNPEITLNRVQQIGEEAVELVFAQDCPNMTTTLVLAQSNDVANP